MARTRSADRPLILVTGRNLELGRVERWREPAVASPSFYVEALTRAGATAPVLGPEPLDGDSAAAVIDRFDGLLLTGGVDVDPGRYGQSPAPQTYGADDMLDEFELCLLHAAVDADLPVLAICRGLQVLNVALGGTLHQHIGDLPAVLPHGTPSGGAGIDMPIEVEPGSRLADALGATSAKGRCHHHQAVDRAGDGLVVTAHTPDGIVEGLERPGSPWVLGVQWHPEDTAATDPQQQALFDSFVAECRS